MKKKLLSCLCSFIGAQEECTTNEKKITILPNNEIGVLQIILGEFGTCEKKGHGSKLQEREVRKTKTISIVLNS